MKNKIIFPIVVMVFVSLACQVLTPSSVSDNVTPAPTQEAIHQPTVTTEISSNSESSIPSESEIVDNFGVPMILVPAGEFTMGIDSDNENIKEETPLHTVYLDAYYMDKYEVTNAQYQACVNDDACTLPEPTSSYTRSSYYGDSEFDNYPVIYVDWDMAKTYCEWRGAQLPTEAQWEKAARGTDGRTYSWGNQFEGDYTNFCDKNCPFDWADKNINDGYEDTAPVGYYLDDISPYGIYDMTGNVSEWVADWYDIIYYRNSPESNPLGPDSSRGYGRVIRGGSWRTPTQSQDLGDLLRVSRRNTVPPDFLDSDIGFRCTRTLTEVTQPNATTVPTQITSSLNMEGDMVDNHGVPMMLVPEGEFKMGSNDGNSNAQPVHTVYLDAYYIDKYEVTNAFYKTCVDAGTCNPPTNISAFGADDYYGNVKFGNYPVIYVNWDMAKTYCEWRGAQLPTEAQWEKAARGTDERIYPWGDALACHVANVGGGADFGCPGHPRPVGSYEDVVSPYGVYDMVGNVTEIVNDWFGQDYYSHSSLSNPLGPDTGEYKVGRGGSYFTNADFSNTYSRFFISASESSNQYGFRCAKDANP